MTRNGPSAGMALRADIDGYAPERHRARIRQGAAAGEDGDLRGSRNVLAGQPKATRRGLGCAGATMRIHPERIEECL